jgi:hypothetical protein
MVRESATGLNENPSARDLASPAEDHAQGGGVEKADDAEIQGRADAASRVNWRVALTRGSSVESFGALVLAEPRAQRPG